MKAFFSNIINYLRTSKAELEKVTWPTKQDTIRYTTAIVVSCVITAIFFSVIDIGLNKAVKTIVTIKSSTIKSDSNDTIPTTEESPINTSEPTIDAVDESGNPAKVKVTPVPVSSTSAVTSTK